MQRHGFASFAGFRHNWPRIEMGSSFFPRLPLGMRHISDVRPVIRQIQLF